MRERNGNGSIEKKKTTTMNLKRAINRKFAN